jgi:hypothetical protein
MKFWWYKYKLKYRETSFKLVQLYDLRFRKGEWRDEVSIEGWAQKNEPM